MEFDIDKPFRKLYKGGRQFKKDLLAALSTQYVRQDTPPWAKDLQFLTVSPSEDTPLEHDKGPYYCTSSTTPDYFHRDLSIPEALATENIAPGYSKAAESCRCASYRRFGSPAWLSGNRATRKALRLTSLGELPECTHYLAVSYRWPQLPSSGECYEVCEQEMALRVEETVFWF